MKDQPMPTPPTILSIVLCPQGKYQAVAEYMRPTSLYPHYVTARKIVIGETPEDALAKIRSALNEQHERDRVE